MKLLKNDHLVSITYLFVALSCFLTAGAYYSSAFTTYSVPSAGAVIPVATTGGLSFFLAIKALS